MESLGSVAKRNMDLYIEPRKKGAKASLCLLARAMAMGK